MNRFRLLEACPITDFSALTGRELTTNEVNILNKLSDKGLITSTRLHWQITELGKRYFNTVLEDFV